MAKSPTQKAMEYLRKLGYEADKVEQRVPIPGKHVTCDLFGCIDVIGMKAGKPLLAVQATSRDNVNARMKKSKAKAAVWVSTGNRFEVWGYGPTGKRTVRMIDGRWVEDDARAVA